jgi:hypothetical protein
MTWITQGMLRRSNMKPESIIAGRNVIIMLSWLARNWLLVADEMTSLITAELDFAANLKVLRAESHMLATLLDIRA